MVVTGIDDKLTGFSVLMNSFRLLIKIETGYISKNVILRASIVGV